MAMPVTRRAWHALIEGMAAEGRPIREIVAEAHTSYPDVTRAQVDGHYRRVKERTTASDNPAVAEWEDRRERAAEDLRRKADVYDWLRPVELPAPGSPEGDGQAERVHARDRGHALPETRRADAGDLPVDRGRAETRARHPQRGYGRSARRVEVSEGCAGGVYVGAP
jgi:hypothetical protein